MQHVDTVLGQSPYFTASQGNDHMATYGVWGWKLVGAHKLFRNFQNCHWLGFGEMPQQNSKRRQYYYKFYVGQACDWETTKVHDLAMVAGMVPKDKRFQSRQDVCDWMSDKNWSVCGRGQQCPALAQSKFGFHVRGDSFGANRLFDTILSGTVPIFTMKEQYGINPGWFDWDEISYFADVTNETVFKESMERILADEEGYQRKHKAVLKNRILFDWTTPYPFDTYMYMLQVHLYPDTRRTETTRFTALRLP